jgi:hypothetical protein
MINQRRFRNSNSVAFIASPEFAPVRRANQGDGARAPRMILRVAHRRHIARSRASAGSSRITQGKRSKFNR